MLKYTTGDLLKSSAQALVNTVNCEGYMGKGIAYQFKLQFPENNKDYVKACKSGDIAIGKIHYFTENNKLIINFPTKNKWRAKSKMRYIEEGLDDLVRLIKELDITSIAIPPLGSGNGGLIWADVKPLIVKRLEHLSDKVEILIYEPSKNYKSKPVEEPKLSTSALVLMEIKNGLTKFDTIRLQKTAFYMDVFSEVDYFRFKAHTYGPYDNSIAIISKNIKEFQNYHGVRDTRKAYNILYNKLTSEQVNNTIESLRPNLMRACNFVNNIETNHELECLSTITYIVKNESGLSDNQIVEHFRSWSKRKASVFTVEEIYKGIENLKRAGIIEQILVGYALAS